MEAAQRIYRPEHWVKLFYSGAEFFDFEDSQAAVLPGDPIVVTFRGTTSTLDWLTNAQAHRVAAKWHGTVHAGFKRYVDRIGAAIYHAVLNMRDREQRILVTGHSLGGVASTIWCDEWLRDENTRKFDVEHITFGSPRPGDAAFAASFHEIFGDVSLRVTNEADLVPHVPTAFPQWLDFVISWFCGVGNLPITPGQYRHAQKNELHFAKNGEIWQNPSASDLCRDFFAGFWDDLGKRGLKGIKDHDISKNYEIKIRGIT